MDFVHPFTAPPSPRATNLSPRVHCPRASPCQVQGVAAPEVRRSDEDDGVTETRCYQRCSQVYHPQANNAAAKVIEDTTRCSGATPPSTSLPKQPPTLFTLIINTKPHECTNMLFDLDTFCTANTNRCNSRSPESARWHPTAAGMAYSQYTPRACIRARASTVRTHVRVAWCLMLSERRLSTGARPDWSGWLVADCACCSYSMRQSWIADDLRLEVRLAVLGQELGVLLVPRSHLEHPRVLHLHVWRRIRGSNAHSEFGKQRAQRIRQTTHRRAHQTTHTRMPTLSHVPGPRKRERAKHTRTRGRAVRQQANH